MSAVIDLSGSPAPWPAEAVEQWADCAARAARVADLWTVPAPRGDDVLREALAAALGFPPDQVTIVASLRAAALTYARRFRRIVVERPTYPGVLPVLAGAGADVALATWPEILRDPGGTPEATAVWLTSPGRNPDGATLSPADRERLAALAGRGYRVVVNGTYAWFVGGRAPAAADSVGSLHKLRGVGARVGWVAGPGYFEEAFPELLGTPPSPVWQRAWGLFLHEGGLALLRATILAETAAAKASFVGRLAAAHGLWLPDFDGPSVLIPLADGDPRADAEADVADAEDAARDALERAGFRTVAARDFHASGPALRATFLGVTAGDAELFADAVASHVRTGLAPVSAPREEASR
jgi:DNA-binding transcriptional MocR family regulator